MIERDRTPATARDGEDAAGGSDSQNPPKLAVGGDDEGDDEGEGEDYVYVGDDWKDVGPSLIPSIVTACLGAFLFGYHSAVINAPLADIAEDLGFGGDNFAKGAVVSIMVVGGFAGGLGIGPFADKEGRRSALVATTIPLALGTLVCGAANSLWTMMLGRFITGAGVGASTQIVPVYLSEVSPPGLRGTVNGIRRMGYVVGCLMAFQLAGPLKDANMPEGYVKPASTLNQSAGLDTYIDAVRSEGKFAVVVEKVKETAAAAERDLVVRVEEKVERLEEKLGGKGSASGVGSGRRRRFRNAAVHRPDVGAIPGRRRLHRRGRQAGARGEGVRGEVVAVGGGQIRRSDRRAGNGKVGKVGKVGEVIGGEDRDRDRARERRVETRRRQESDDAGPDRVGEAAAAAAAAAAGDCDDSGGGRGDKKIDHFAGSVQG